VNAARKISHFQQALQTIF